MKLKNLKPSQLSKLIDVSAELIIKFRKGDLTNPTLNTLIKIANFFEIPLSELVFADVSNEQKTNVSKPSSIYIPVIPSNKFDQPVVPDIATEYITINQFLGDHVFATRLEYDYGIFKKNVLLIIDNKLNIKHNDYILVKNNHSNLISIRQVIVDDSFYLKSIIADISTIVKLDADEYTVYGVILGYQKQHIFSSDGDINE
jgi:transcriptional regulator with XRE-family HTH domain